VWASSTSSGLDVSLNSILFLDTTESQAKCRCGAALPDRRPPPPRGQRGTGTAARWHVPLVSSAVQYKQATSPRPSLLSRLSMGALRTPAMAPYEPRAPSRTGLYQVSAAHLEMRDDDPEATGLPAYVRREFYDYLQ